MLLAVLLCAQANRAKLDTASYEEGSWTWVSKAVDTIVDDEQEIDTRVLSMILQAYTRASMAPVQTQSLTERKMFPPIEGHETHGIDTGTLVRWAGYVISHHTAWGTHISRKNMPVDARVQPSTRSKCRGTVSRDQHSAERY
jgi:hypothetical protein